MPLRTYLDSNVLIVAFRGDDVASNLALEILDDPERALIVSDYVRLETIPKPTYYNRREEIAFMNEVWSSAVESVAISSGLTAKAIEFASKYDLSPMDSLHAAAAFLGNVDEFVTLEKPTSPLGRLREVNVVSIHPLTENKGKL